MAIKAAIAAHIRSTTGEALDGVAYVNGQNQTSFDVQ